MNPWRISYLFLLISTSASASPMIDFSIGGTGPLGTTSTVVSTIQVDSIGGTLFRWNGTYCCNHQDLGFGILSPTDLLNFAEPEIDKTGTHEWLRIKALDQPITGIWLSSVNDAAHAQIYSGIYPAGTHLDVTTATCGGPASMPAYSCYVPLDPTAYLWLDAGGVAAHNYWLVWGVDVAHPPSIPEPATLLLLALGLGGLGRLARKPSQAPR